MNNFWSCFYYKFIALNPIQDGHFWGSLQIREWVGGKKATLTVTHILP